MTEWEDPELVSFHRQTKTAIMYKTTLSEKDLKTSRTALPQLRILKKKKSHQDGVGGTEIQCSQDSYP